MFNYKQNLTMQQNKSENTKKFKINQKKKTCNQVNKLKEVKQIQKKRKYKYSTIFLEFSMIFITRHQFKQKTFHHKLQELIQKN